MNPVAMGTLHHIELWVPDLSRAEHTWGWLLGALGYELYQQWPEGASWRAGDLYIVLEQSPARSAFRHDRYRPGLNHLAFHVADQAAVDRLVGEALLHGWRLLFADRHPYAGGEQALRRVPGGPRRLRGGTRGARRRQQPEREWPAPASGSGGQPVTAAAGAVAGADRDRAVPGWPPPDPTAMVSRRSREERPTAMVNWPGRPVPAARVLVVAGEHPGGQGERDRRPPRPARRSTVPNAPSTRTGRPGPRSGRPDPARLPRTPAPPRGPARGPVLRTVTSRLAGRRPAGWPGWPGWPAVSDS